MARTIRLAEGIDAELLVKLIRKGFQDVAKRFDLSEANCPKHPSNCVIEWIEGDLDRGVKYYIIEEDSGPCGCVGLEQVDSDVCYLERLTILPEFRRRGMGECLLKHATRVAKSLGAARLEIGIIADDTELRDWYRKRGFDVTGARRFPHLPFEVTFMVKTL